MIASIVALTCALCFEFRQFLPVLQEHLEDYDGEVIAHLLLPDIVRWMLHNPLERDLHQRVWLWLEAAYVAGDTHERELVVLSAVEMIPDPGMPGADMRSLLGPVLSTEDPWNRAERASQPEA